MPTDVLFVLLVLAAALLGFATDRLPMDIVALMVMVVLALSGLVSVPDALGSFSNRAVVSTAAMFVLTGGLARTGVAGILARRIQRLGGAGEAGLVMALMLVAGCLSAFMNNVGVVALLMPQVIDISRRRGIAASRLLMPLSFAALLGGLVTLIGTAPNLIISDQLGQAAGGEGFHMFDFAPVGLAVLVVGTAYMVLVGRHLLPGGGERGAAAHELGGFYDLHERIFAIRVPQGSSLAGLSLVETRLGSALSLNVLAIQRGEETFLAPDAGMRLRVDDRLIVRGRRDHFETVRQERHLKLVDDEPSLRALAAQGIGLAAARLAHGSALAGQTLVSANFRQRHGLIVLAIQRRGHNRVFDFHYDDLEAGDLLLVQGGEAALAKLAADTGFEAVEQLPVDQAVDRFGLRDTLFLVRVEAVSPLIGRSLVELRPESFGLTVLGFLRGGELALMPEPGYRIQRADVILVKGRPDQLAIMHGYEDLVLETGPLDLRLLDSERVGMQEVVLSPHTRLVGQTLRALHFRERFGLNVLAIWREGQALRTRVKDIRLRFGDALLVFGRRNKLGLLAEDPDFIVLSETAQHEPRREKALLAGLIFVGGVILPTAFLGVPVAISAMGGALGMVATGCLSSQEANRFIHWPAIFLIAGMMPLGRALENSGAAAMLAAGLTGGAAPFGATGVLAGIFLAGAFLAQLMPSPAVALLMGPVAMMAARASGLSLEQAMMMLAVAASSSFFSPVGHPANALVMGSGGYRLRDFLRAGLPLTFIVMIVALVTVPRFVP